MPQLMSRFAYRNVMEVPRITKISLNMGLGEAVADKKIVEHALRDMAQIAGQKPVVTNARKSIAGFKIRDGWPVGCKVTLRRDRMYEFLDRLIAVALPRVRDFRGVNGRGFDGRGNFSMGISEQIIFPKSTTTRSTPCAVWISPSPPRRARTRKAEPCSKVSASRSATEE